SALVAAVRLLARYAKAARAGWRLPRQLSRCPKITSALYGTMALPPAVSSLQGGKDRWPRPTRTRSVPSTAVVVRPVAENLREWLPKSTRRLTALSLVLTSESAASLSVFSPSGTAVGELRLCHALRDWIATPLPVAGANCTKSTWPRQAECDGRGADASSRRLPARNPEGLGEVAGGCHCR